MLGCVGGPHIHDIIIGGRLHFPRHRDVPSQTRVGIFCFPSGREVFHKRVGPARLLNLDSWSQSEDYTWLSSCLDSGNGREGVTWWSVVPSIMRLKSQEAQRCTVDGGKYGVCHMVALCIAFVSPSLEGKAKGPSNPFISNSIFPASFI